MRLLVCGDRNWTDRAAILRELSAIKDKLECVIEGEARGADSIARDVAEELGVEVIGVPANWKVAGKGAGPKRNREMLNYRPDMVYAFHSDIGGKQGNKEHA